MRAAFDILQHSHSLKIIKKPFGIDETVLELLQSNLTDRKCCVLVNEAKAEQCYLTTRVPFSAFCYLFVSLII